METEIDRALGGVITRRSLRSALGFARHDQQRLLLRSEDGCPCAFQQLCRVKISGPQFRNKTGNSRVVSKANFQKGISRFESRQPSQPVGSLDFCLGTSRKSSRTRRFVRFRRSPIRPRSHRTSQFLRKISRRCLKNSRFKETKSGDSFDLRLRDRPSRSMSAFAVAVRICPLLTQCGHPITLTDVGGKR